MLCGNSQGVICMFAQIGADLRFLGSTLLDTNLEHGWFSSWVPAVVSSYREKRTWE